MAVKTPSPLLLLLLPFLLISPSAAHNITRLLSQYPDFATFNSLLTQTELSKEINSRTTITVLAVDGAGLGGIAGLPTDILKRVLSVHVVLDYYDEEKLHKLSKHSALLTTLFQTSGVADSKRGFLNVTERSDGEVSFGSATSGAGLSSNLVKAIAARPYNISVLQVSSVIMPPGIDGSNHTTPSPPPPAAKAPSSAVSPAPAKSKKKSKAPVEAPAPAADAPVADAPVADAPVADAPVADAPAGDSPLSSPPSPTEADIDAADAPAPGTPSSTGRVAVGAGVGVVMGALLLGTL